MQFISSYFKFAFAFVLLCCCYGMPPKESLPTTRNRCFFSDQEHELLFKMLDSFGRSGVCYDRSVWRGIGKAFQEKREAHVEGFSTPRTSNSLQRHFFHIAESNKPMKESLLRLYEQMKKSFITPQEQDFINREVLQSGDDEMGLLGDKLWRNIQKKHEKKRKAGELGFSKKRSYGVLRTHFKFVMTAKNLVDEAVKRKFPHYFKNQSGTALDGGTNQLATCSSENVCRRYSNQEVEELLKMLESKAKEGSYRPSLWKEIKEEFDKKRNANVEGFVTRRSLRSLQQNFISILRSGKTDVPDVLRNLYDQMKRMSITCEEQEFINRELSRSDLPDWNLNANQRWKDIEKKHNAYREAGIPGFANRRLWRTLANHFNGIMKPRNLVDDAVKAKFPHDFETNQGLSSAEEEEQLDCDSGEIMDLDTNEDFSTWIDEYGVDDFMLTDPTEENCFYIEN